MPFPQQIRLRNQISTVDGIFERHQLDASKINALKPLIDHFEIRLPFIGGFSSGKSSLINALIKEPLLSTEITAETAVAAELRYGTARRFVGQLPGGKTHPFSEEDVRHNRLSALIPHGWLNIELPCDALAAHPHLVLVDMPGWGSGIEAHQRVVDDYADRSLAYVVVVSVEEGTLRDNLRKALLELAVQDKPVILVVSKAHKRSDDEAAAVAKALTTEITQLMGQAPQAVALTSAAKRDTAQLERALHQLDAKAEAVFEASIVKPWRSELQRAAQLMQMLTNQDFQDAALISAEIENFEQKMREFDERLARETEGLEERVGPMIGAIRIRVENALAGRLDALTDRALAGSNISDDILGTARLVISQALKEEFEPTMHRYLDRLADALPSQLDFQLDFGSNKVGDNTGNEFGWKGLATTLGPLLIAIPHPFAKIAAVVLPILGSLFGGSSDRKRQEIEEARQHERARSKVRSALTEAAAQIEAQLQPVMQQQVQKAKEAVTKNIATERADVQKILQAKRRALEEGETQAAAQRALAQADLQQLTHMLDDIATEHRP